MTLNCETVNLKKGSKGAEVTELQTILKELGYYTRQVDGDFGVYTAEAVRKFQKATGHTQDGWFGPKTCKSLNQKTTQTNNIISFDCPNTNLRLNSTNKDAVKKLQTMLKELGYYTRQVDGDFGTYTEEAVKKFQTKYGHTSDGWFGPKTCASLNKAYSEFKTNQINATKNTTSTNTPVKVLTIDTVKEQFLPEGEGNFTIQGIRFIVNEITDTTTFKDATWNKLELMNNKLLVYQGHRQPREYDVVTYIQMKNFRQVYSTLSKMSRMICKVISEPIAFISGDYVISSIKRASDEGDNFKFTLHFIEVVNE